MGLFDDIVDAPLSRAPVSNDGPGLFSELLDFGEGALFGLLDVLDRPGRSVRHLLSGNFGQALEAFDPFNLITEQESTPSVGGTYCRILASWERTPRAWISPMSRGLGRRLPSIP